MAMTLSDKPPSDKTPLAPKAHGVSMVETIFKVRELGIVGVLVVFVLSVSIIQPRFLQLSNIRFILIDTTIFAFLSLGETMIIVSRNVDLSIGSVLGLSAFISSNLYQQFHNPPILVVIGCGLLVGIVCGAINGALVAFGRVPSLVVTLATLYIFRGIDVIVVGGQQVVANSLPQTFLDITHVNVAGIPAIAIVVAAIVVGGWYYMKNYSSGRDLYAIGSSPQAADLVGVPTTKRLFYAFMISGAIAGLCGVLWASYYGTIDSTAGTGYELTVVAGVVVGGVAIFGGSGSVIGAAIGALLLNSINSGLYVLGVSSFWDMAISGALLLGAIALDRGIFNYMAHALTRREPSVAS